MLEELGINGNVLWEVLEKGVFMQLNIRKYIMQGSRENIERGSSLRNSK